MVLIPFPNELNQLPSGTLPDIICRNTLLYANSESFVCSPQRIAFKDCTENTTRIGHALEKQTSRKEDNIGIVSWNSAEYGEVCGVVMKRGVVLVIFNPRFKPFELICLIYDVEAKALFVGLFLFIRLAMLCRCGRWPQTLGVGVRCYG